MHPKRLHRIIEKPILKDTEKPIQNQTAKAISDQTENDGKHNEKVRFFRTCNFNIYQNRWLLMYCTSHDSL